MDKQMEERMRGDRGKGRGGEGKKKKTQERTWYIKMLINGIQFNSTKMAYFNWNKK